MTSQPIMRLHAIVRGRVQGVGFRYFVKDAAERLGLTGWTRNQLDNTVEVMAEGNQSQLDSLLAELRKGPPASQVADVDANYSDATGEFARFEVRRTG